MHIEARTIPHDPDVMRLSGQLGALTRDGRTAEAAEVREKLDRARRMAAIRSAVNNAPPMDAATLGSIVTTLVAAATR